MHYRLRSKRKRKPIVDSPDESAAEEESREASIASEGASPSSSSPSGSASPTPSAESLESLESGPKKRGPKPKPRSSVQNKFRLRMQTVDTSSKVNRTQVLRYVNDANASFRRFHDENPPSDVLRELAALDSEFTAVKKPGPSLERWQNTQSLRLHFRTAQSVDLKPLFSDPKDKKQLMVAPNPLNAPKVEEFRSLNFLEGESFDYATSLKKPAMFEGVNVAHLAEGVVAGKKAAARTPAYAKNGGVFFCGGPIAALALCPRCDANGEEVLAVATFADEVAFVTPPFDRTSTHVQLWTLPKKLGDHPPRCQFLLEVPAACVLELAWCPLLIERKAAAGASNGAAAKRSKEADDCLGLLAVCTNRGAVLVFRLPRQHPTSARNKSPPVLRFTPVAVLAHPVVTITRYENEPKADQKPSASSSARETPAKEATEEPMEAESHEQSVQPSEDGANSSLDRTVAPKQTAIHTTHADVPLSSLVWSHFHEGDRLAAVSDAGYVYVWDLSSEAVDFDPQARADTADHLAGISAVRYPVQTIRDDEWDSPPGSVCWTAEDEIVVNTRNRSINLYKMPALTPLLRDATARTAGCVLRASPPNFRGFFSVDTVVAHYEGCNYAGANYLLVNEDEDVFLVTPVLSTHQWRFFDAAICPRSGLFSSVGLDGRLNQMLVGRVFPRTSTADMSFHYGRPLLQVVRCKEPPAAGEEDERPAVIQHSECVANSWLEIRAGDAALMDTHHIRKHRYQIPEVVLDRRTESLTRVAASSLTPGLTAAGGEAGLVFVVPSLL